MLWWRCLKLKVKFIILAVAWEILRQQDLNSLVGVGSKIHLEDLIRLITLVMPSSDIIPKGYIKEGGSGSFGCLYLYTGSNRIFFFFKKSKANSSHLRVDELLWWLSAGDELRRLLFVEIEMIILASRYNLWEMSLTFLTVLLWIINWSLKMLKWTCSFLFFPLSLSFFFTNCSSFLGWFAD